MRSIFDQAFRPGKIKELEPNVESLSYELINAFLDDGYCDWVKPVSYTHLTLPTNREV